MKVDDVFILLERDRAEKLLREQVIPGANRSPHGTPPPNQGNGWFGSSFFGSGQHNGQPQLIPPEEPDEKLFGGEIYKDKTRIKPFKRGLFSIKRSVQGTAGFVDRKYFPPIFILGYEIHSHDLVYEIWYDSYIGKYQIYDKYGMPIGQEKDGLNKIVELMVDLLGSQGAQIMKNDPRFTKGATDSVRRQGYKVSDLDNDKVRPTRESKEARKALKLEMEPILQEAAIISKSMLADALIGEVKEYTVSKLHETDITNIFRNIFGKPIDSPKDFMYVGLRKLRHGFDRLVGREMETTFVKGYCLADKINLEIWYAKDVKLGKNTFYVYDLTSHEILASEITVLRNAVQVVNNKLKVIRKTTGT